MVKYLFIYVAILVILWVLNIIITIPLRKRVGDSHEYFKKVVDNGNNLFFDLVGLIILTVSLYLFEPLKWVGLVGYGLFSLWNIITILISIITTAVIFIKYKKNQLNELILIGSNIIEICGSFLILYAFVHHLFGWL